MHEKIILVKTEKEIQNAHGNGSATRHIIPPLGAYPKRRGRSESYTVNADRIQIERIEMTKPLYLFSCGCRRAPVYVYSKLAKIYRPSCPDHPDGEFIGKVWPCKCGCGKEVTTSKMCAKQPVHPDCRTAREKKYQQAYNKQRVRLSKLDMIPEEAETVPEKIARIIRDCCPVPRVRIEDYPGIMRLRKPLDIA